MSFAITDLTTILFDADGTLWDFDTAMRHALSCTLAELERLIPSARGLLSVDALIATRDRVAAEIGGQTWSLEAIRHKAFERALAASRPSRHSLDRRHSLRFAY